MGKGSEGKGREVTEGERGQRNRRDGSTRI